MPRGPYVILLIMGLTGFALAFLTEPTFLGGGGFAAFTHERMAGATVALFISLWGCKGFLFPKTLFVCNRSGIEIPAYPRLIEWRHVQDVDVSTLTLGMSNVNRGGAVRSAAIVIRFAENIDLRSGFLPNSHGRITADHEYAFSTEVQKKDPSDILEEIKRFWLTLETFRPASGHYT